MTNEELDEKLLNRTPHSGSHHYDGFMFLASFIAYRRKKKRERLKKLKIMGKQKIDQSIESSNYEKNIHLV
jgi:hypothetical protein